MPKVGMEPIRRSAVVQATITEIGHSGTLDVTVGQIAKRAGVSTALVHHYFGSKDQVLLAAMRHVLSVYGTETRASLLKSESPRQRAEAIICTSFSKGNFKKEILSAWLNFYVAAHNSTEAKRLLHVYQCRLVSNLAHALRPMIGDRAVCASKRLAALIDGIYLHVGLGHRTPDRDLAVQLAIDLLDLETNANPN